jgi:ABC-type dipeptide/oligopeptide/nickel transport system permease component
MGSFLIDSMFHRDFVVIQAIVVLVGLMVLSLNLIIDLLYGVLDPRIHYT